VVNGKAVESAIRIGLALNCSIAPWCRFARKNYFYPDMPKNFQTSQYDEPIAFNGFTEVDVDGETYRVEIERAHMEEDTGKSLHVGGSTGRIHGGGALAARLQPRRRAADRDRHQAHRGDRRQGAAGSAGVRRPSA
jgi:Asp-tRNA(Asn)/Glu-tRNA(Gln) amidotransferase B subunit